MPKCGSQCLLCDVPVRFDTYKGCSHACSYCFAKKFTDLNKIKKDESVDSLVNFISGKRTKETNWADWNIPLHWGGLSDPFQPVEKIHRVSYECLKVLAETKYPVIISTKGYLVADDEYLDLIEECNAVIQISLVCSKYDKIESGCPPFEDRLKIIEKVSKKAKRVIVRIQPYMLEVYDDVHANLERFAKAGAYGVIIEGMKFRKKKPGLIKVGGDMVYPYELIEEHFLKLQKRAHEVGLRIYAGENRIRKLGDHLTCCGIEELDGFKPNTYNLNHILNGDVGVKPTAAQTTSGTATCLTSLHQDTIHHRLFEDKSYAEIMMYEYKLNEQKLKNTFGLTKK